MKQASLSIPSENLENVHQRAEAEAELEKERDRQKGEGGSWSHLSSVSSEDFPLCHTSPLVPESIPITELSVIK